MRIGIDARLINETGVGRYIRNLVREICHQDKINEYTIFLKKKEYTSFELPNPRWKKVLADVGWHSVSEQLIMPWLLLQARLDLVHIPYFTIPIFYPGAMVVTIHDLTILHFDTGRATTLPLLLYKLRRVGYIVALALGLRRVGKIITVSHATKQELMDHFHIKPGKIVVTYEGVDGKIKEQRAKNKEQKRLIKNPYFLYVGNAYPHKNLEMLLRAFQSLITHHSSLITLVLVGKEDFFYRRIKKFVHGLNLDDRVIFFGEAQDDELSKLYAHAIALVFPSLMEGFGLPALEALALGCPVIVSDIPVFHEILGDYAVYFNPSDIQDLKGALMRASGGGKKLYEGDLRKFLNSYSWSTLASDTVDVYRKSL